jgi:hypothetical protein
MKKFNPIKLPILFLVCVMIALLAGCNKATLVKSDPIASKSAQEVKIPYVDIKPVMPNIPKDIGNVAIKDKYKGESGYGITAQTSNDCSLDAKSKFIITYHFKDNSGNPVVIENIDGTRFIGSKACSVELNSGSMELNDQIVSMPVLGVTLSNNYQPISDYGVNPKVRFIQITQEKGGQWNREQMGLIYSNYNK